MRILYACHQFLPAYYTGTERYTLELVKQLQRMGHYAMVLTYDHLSADGMQPFHADILCKPYYFERVPVVAWRHNDFQGGTVEPDLSFRLRDPQLEAAFEQLLAEQAFDILHTTHLMRIFPILHAAKRRGLKIVTHLTDYWMLCPRATLLRPDGSLCEGADSGRNCARHCYEARWTDALLERYRRTQEALRLADTVISPSQFLIDVFKQNGSDTDRFVYRRHGFDYSKVKFVKKGRLSQEGVITFGFVGTILPHKGVHTLLEAVKKIASDHIRLKIHGGYFDRRDYYQSLLALAGGDPRIEFCGEYDFQDVARVLEEIDVIVVPSIWYENAPLVISTAHAFGIPVIATDLGGMAEMVQDRVNGLTFRMGDSDDLAKKICAMADDPGLLETFSRHITPPPRIEGDALFLEADYTKLLQGEPSTITPIEDRAGRGVSANLLGEEQHASLEKNSTHRQPLQEQKLRCSLAAQASSLLDTLKLHIDSKSYPIPPDFLLQQIGGPKATSMSYLYGGYNVSEEIRWALRLIGRNLHDVKSILDFGCGCARVLRRFEDLVPACQLYGADISKETIDWCKKNIPFAKFTKNDPLPPLPFPDESFDLIYGISVLTHLDEGYQFAWLKELQRIAKPGAIVILTVHGDYKAYGDLSDEDYMQLEKKGFVYKRVVKQGGVDGLPNFYQTTYHSRNYIEREWSRFFQISAYLRQGPMLYHDMVVMEKAGIQALTPTQESRASYVYVETAIVWLETPQMGELVEQDQLVVKGWAFHPDGRKAYLDIWIDGEKFGSCVSEAPRPDVARDNPKYLRAKSSGFSTTLSIKHLSKGPHVLWVFSGTDLMPASLTYFFKDAQQ